MRPLYIIIFLAIAPFAFGQELNDFKKSNLGNKSFSDTSLLFCYYNTYPGHTEVSLTDRVRRTYDGDGNETLSESIDDIGVVFF